jgi:hypothetical protein
MGVAYVDDDGVPAAAPATFARRVFPPGPPFGFTTRRRVGECVGASFSQSSAAAAGET